MFHTEANYVHVDVYPTANGVPVGDLQPADFELFEDGKVQKIDQFERIVIRPRATVDERRDPNSVAEMRSMMETSRGRLFALFLDDGHVDVASSHDIRKPLTDALERLVGPDDLFGLMLPEMAATQIAFGRKTTTIDGILANYWHWGERSRITTRDPVEEQYNQCYPGNPPSTDPRLCQDDDRGVAAEMILRRRETRTLDALEDLTRYLQGVREERKAVLVVSEGWQMFAPNQRLARRLNCEVPTGTPPILGPGQKAQLGQPASQQAAASRVCDRDRMNLAQLDDQRRLRTLADEANRANVSFYTIDPRGLPVFDQPLSFTTPLPPADDQAMLRNRIDTLKTLASATDGIAIVNSNDLDKGLRRITDDLSSYYLFGYYSTGKLDGKFHAITVRVKRPGVQVRARRGFLAATAEEAANRNATVVTTPADEAAAADAREIEDAVGTLATFSREVPMRVQIAAGWKTDQSAAVWAVGEVAATEDWKAGGDADLTLTTAAGVTVATQHAHLDPGSRTFRVPLTSTSPLVAADYALRVSSRSAGGAIPHTDQIRFALPPAPGVLGAIYIRRGPSSGNKEVVTADLRYRRSDRIRVEVPGVSPTATARLLDRRGKPLAVPLTTATRNDADGTRWLTAEVALAPLAAADYVIEFTGEAGRAGGKRTLVAFRVVP